ncbi:LysR substrate-binding domain-containing protein [Ancylobacter lacus]|uniref:LysR substrate-binding domain-containing protein n=1 Tax=Ancylobacter lacus TaxID=2579970 RepID=UPI001BD0A734|nr:LysR substrate-binding domain-containing protein [Ancylobacter lacus]MBS7540567.1 LysR family transcriptional regulator [Ancylobacter lacus]
MHFGFDLDLLRTFVAVVDSGGFTRAAERVHLTQSTVSLQVKKLEQGLGHVLLLRERAGAVRVTEEGERLLGYARRLLALSAEASEVLRRPGAPRTIRLGVPEDFAGRRLIDLLAGFAGRWPDTRLDTVSGLSLDLRRLLEQGELDLALAKREPGDGTALASWTEPLVWVGAAGSGIEAGLPAPDEPVPLAVFSAGCIYRDRAIRAIEEAGRGWRIAYASQGLSGVQAAVAAGLGLSLLPREAVLAEHRVLSGFGLPEQGPTELALFAAARRPERRVRALADFLVGHIDGLHAPARPADAVP